MASWFGTLEEFADGHNKNIIATLLPSLRATSLSFLLISLIAAGVICVVLGNRLAKRTEGSADSDFLDLAGLCGIVGYLSFYHVHYDKIMLYPALLACLRLSFLHRKSWIILLTALMTATLWIPEKVIGTVPNSAGVEALIWSLVGVVLLLRTTKPQYMGGTEISRLINR